MTPTNSELTSLDAIPPADVLSIEPRWKMWGCLVLLLVGLHIGIGGRVRLSSWSVPRTSNAALDEAIQWKHGTMALSGASSRWEAPKINGKFYNAVGPAFVLLSIVGTTISGWLGAEPDTFFSPLYVLMIAVPVPIIAFGAFRSLTRSSAWGAILAAYLIAGTAIRPITNSCRVGSIYYIDHLLATMGLLLLAADLLGKRRIWPSLLGLALAVWSRQMTCFYAIPIFWIAARTRSVDAASAAGLSPSRPDRPPPSTKRSRVSLALAGIAVVAAFPMTLSYLKFGNPLESGYPGMYEGRTDPVARDAHLCFWGPHWFARDFKAMNLAVPALDVRENSLFLDCTDVDGGSIWVTTPILLAIFFSARRWWRDPTRRLLMLTTIPVVIGICGYHATEAHSCGYYGYALDVIPVWFAVIAPYVTTRRAVPWTLAAMAWSVVYFHTLLP